MSSNPALDAVLANAKTAAANYTPPAVQDAQTNAPAVVGSSGGLARPSMDAIVNGGGITVDEYLQSKAEGFRISKDMKGLLEEIVVEIDMSDVVPIYQSRHETNGSTTFIKSYDGVTTSMGGNFEQAVANANAVNLKNTGVYSSAEIPVELAVDAKDPKTSLVIHAGTMIGITPSLTGFKEFQKFCKALTKKDPNLVNAVIKAKIKHLKRTNSNNNEWGVVEFEYLEAA